jgi:hypothetical protein
MTISKIDFARCTERDKNEITCVSHTVQSQMSVSNETGPKSSQQRDPDEVNNLV